MNLRVKIQLLGCLLSTFALSNAVAFLPPSTPPLPNLDRRLASEPAAVPAQKEAAAKALGSRVSGLGVDFDERLGTPKWIRASDGFLSGPRGRGKAISAQIAATFSADDPDLPTKAFIQEHAALFGFGPEVLGSARSKREFTTPHSGLRTVIWEQELDGIPVFEALLISHTTKAQELVSISSQFIPEAGQAADKGTPERKSLMAAPAITPAAAVALSMKNLGEQLEESEVTATDSPAAGAELRQSLRAPRVAGSADVKLTWLPMTQLSLRLCWDVILTSQARGEMYRLLVDAETGEVLVRHCLTDYLVDATYRVYTSDSPSPFSPGYATPQTTQPPLVARDLVVISALNPTASPNGWIDDAVNETYGNNVDAHTDRNADNAADLPRPHGSPNRVFDFPLDLGQAPSAYTNAAVVQLFYWNNWMHDKLYELGFTEAAGNFQSNNFSRGGLGNDAVQADAQDGSGTDNANFSTPPDGSAGRMQMYVFTGPTPDRDGDFDAEVVLHEYTHGLSNRRVGGGVGISAQQSGGMGEGWSDFYGLSLLSAAGDDVNGVYAAGAYASYLINSSQLQNYYSGIRRYPYCTDMAKNPLTFKDIDPGQADNCSSGAPYNTGCFGTCSTSSASEVHNVGEVWCMTLWEARANLVTKLGWAAGNQLMLQLVTDGMNLSPANPTFVQARDAIVQADQVVTGGANRAALWAAFAKRGLGVSAASPASTTTTGVKEAFDVPDNLQITPAVLASSGPVGGPFTPNPAYFAVTNLGTNSLTWSLTSGASWITVLPTRGTLPGGAGTSVSVTLSATTTNFPLGTSSATVWFTNQATGVVQARTFNLNVVGRSLFENFEPGIHLPLWSSFGGVPGTTVIATNYGGSVSGINSLWFGGDGSRFAATIPVNISAGGTISFYLRLGNGSYPWENVDIPGEGIVLEYSTNSGATWFVMGTYDTSKYYAWSQVTTNLPVGSLSTATQFRWRQLSNSGSTFDNWALDDISIDAGPTPPSIVLQPLSQTTKTGSNVVFTVSVFGSMPLSYQWRKDGVNLANGGRIAGVTNASLTISSLLESDSGFYSVVATNPHGAATSTNATLVVTSLDHFTWNIVPSPQAVGVPFDITITAKDSSNGTVTNFTGTVNLSAAGAGSGEAYRIGFENGLEGFTTNNSYGLGNGLWHLSTGRGTQAGHSPSTSVYFGTGEGPNGGGTYNTGTSTEGVMVSPLIDLGSFAGPLSLSFACLIQSEAGTSWDHATVEISTNNGASYVTLASNNQGGQLFGTDSGGLWISVTNDFSAYAGRQVRLRLHFNTIDSGANNYEGWYVDDIVVSGPIAPVPVSPTISGNFTNGTWSGSLSFQAAASNVVLRADDGSNHSGKSNPFDVLLQNDISISATALPNPASVGGNLTYTLTIANSGPLSATGVTVTNFLPANAAFVSAVSSQGICSQNGGVLTCVLGTVSPGVNPTVTIVVTPTVAGGTLSNLATISRSEADAYLANNSVTLLTAVAPPAVSIGDASIVEGDAGTTGIVFQVSLNVPGTQTITVNYATASGGALAGIDFQSTNGVLVFSPGMTNQTITVPVVGDLAVEANEIFFVNLSNGVNTVITRSQGVGTIINNDGLPGQVDHFDWDVIPSPQYAAGPFGVTVRARDAFNGAVTNFAGPVNFSGTINPGTAGTQAVQVLTFTLYADTSVTGEYLHTLTAISNYFPNFVETTTTETNAASLQTQLAGKQVFLIVEQEFAPAGVLGQLGSGCASVLSNFVNNGGIVIACSYMAEEYLILSNSGLMNLTKVSASGSDIVEIGAGHILNEGVTAPFLANYIGRFTATNAITVLRTASNGFGIVLARDLGAGHVVLIGTDYNMLGTALDRVVANAVHWAQGSSAGNVPVSPVISGSFTDGVWSGSVMVGSPGTNVVLHADDGNGHQGLSNPFDVKLQDDVALTAAAFPEAIPLGANVTYTLTISNVGPSSATGVIVTNILDPKTAFVSASVSQGTFTSSSGTVACNLGTLNGNAAATVVIVAAATAGGNITNLATVARSEADPYPANNSVVTVTPVVLPSVTINDLTLREGNSGTTNAVFTLSVSPPPALPIAISYYTANGTAVAPADYLATNGIVSFAPGEISKTISVTVNGDTWYEANEGFAMYISAISNATTARVSGVAMIQNDDSPPTLSVGDVTVSEGNLGTNFAIFPVTLSGPAGLWVTVNYATTNGTATNGSDYVFTSGSLSFPAGTISNYVSVPILGDTVVEPDEDFYVDLSNPAYATLAKREGIAVILNDDALPGQVDHFIWSTPAPVQFCNEPFIETITAVDAFNDPVLSFNGSVNLTGLNAGPLSTNTILPNVNYTGSSYSGYTCGYSFTPTNDITVTHVRAFSGTKISIWTDTGTLLTSQAVVDSKGSWIDTALTTPLKLTAGTRYRVGVYGSSIYYSSTATNVFPNGTIDQGYYYYGDGFPNSTITLRWFFVDLRYTSGTLVPAPILPANAGPFTNGVWTGNITSPAPTPSLLLKADDGNGHSGVSSPPVSVQVHNDISVTISDSPHPVCAGGQIMYSLLVSNTGPSIATGIVVTNWLPEASSYVFAISSQGACSNSGNRVMCALGSLDSADSAEIVILANVTLSSGTITNKATVYRGELDPYITNNTATVATPVVAQPALAINDVAVREGNSGTTNATFTVSVSPPPGSTVTVNFASANGTASAPADYNSTNGIISFNPGQSSKTISVQVIGNVIYASNRLFYVNLSAPINAALGKSQGIGTIVNDDPLPTLSIADLSFSEGNVGTNDAVFVVTLSNPSSLSTTCIYKTVIGTAYSASDFVAKTGTLVVPALATSATISVAIIGDIFTEPDEVFYIDLTSPVNAALGKREAVATILNDDGLPGQVDHFAWYPLPAAHYAGQPLPTTIIAVDAFNNPVVNFTNVVMITATNAGGGALPILPAIASPFKDGFWTGSLVESLPATNILVRADDGNGHIGWGGPITFLPYPVLKCTAADPGWLTLTWSGPCTLQYSTNAAGPYYNLSQATSPWSVGVGSLPACYFRLKAPPAWTLMP